MRGHELQATLDAIGLTQRAGAEFVDHDERTMRRYISGEMAVPVAVAKLFKLMAERGIKPEEVPEP